VAIGDRRIKILNYILGQTSVDVNYVVEELEGTLLCHAIRGGCTAEALCLLAHGACPFTGKGIYHDRVNTFCKPKEVKFTSACEIAMQLKNEVVLRAIAQRLKSSSPATAMPCASNSNQRPQDDCDKDRPRRDL
jgi:hypothetical protein